MHNYTEAKNVFIDEVRVDEYIGLESSKKAYDKLEQSFDRSIKMILLYGQPGTGKTMMLHRLYQNNRHQRDLHLIDTPLGNKKEFYSRLFTIFTGKMMPANSTVHFDTLVDYGRAVKGKREIMILLDEAQMYPSELLEEIRILSDTGSIKFIIALHKTTDEDVIAKEHFQSRIWESIELKNASVNELKTYVYRRLLNRGLMEVANQFGQRQHKFIFAMTKGNYRQCNKLLYSAFEIMEYYSEHEPDKMDYHQISMKILEMSAIKTGLIDV
jgi:thymidine kinase